MVLYRHNNFTDAVISTLSISALSIVSREEIWLLIFIQNRVYLNNALKTALIKLRCNFGLCYQTVLPFSLNYN